jgi:hypothetical protein
VPDRIIRDEIRRSHRFVHLPSDTHRVLFYHLVLDADDFGNAEATTTALALIMARPVSEELAASWLSTLADVDLVRLYEFDGKRYAHIPRFRQRLRSNRGKHPLPPSSIECREMKVLRQKVGQTSVMSRTDVGHLLTEKNLGRIEGKGSEGKRSEVKPRLQSPSSDAEKSKPVDKSQGQDQGPRPNETATEYQLRLEGLAAKAIKPFPK